MTSEHSSNDANDVPDESIFGMRQLLIHVGYPKTATTWLQTQLFNDSEIFEPLSNQRTRFNSLAKLFSRDEEGYFLSPFRTNEENIRQETERLVQENPALRTKIAVLSNERLSGDPHSSGFDAARIASTLPLVFPRAKVLIVIREQKSWLLSNYNQYLSVGGTLSLERYLNTKYDGKRPGFSPAHADFTPLVRRYHREYGPENVLVLPYELFCEEPQAFLAALGDLLGTQIPVDEARFGNVVNKKDCPFLLYYTRFLGPLLRSNSLNNFRGNSRFTRRSVKAFRRIAGALTPTRLSVRLKQKQAAFIASWVGNRYEKTNRALARLIDRDLGRYGYYPSSAAQDIEATQPLATHSATT